MLKIVFTLACLWIICMYPGLSQSPNPDEILANVQSDNFFEIQQAINDYYAEHPNARGQNQWRRKEWFLEPRVYPDGKMENIAEKTFFTYEKYTRSLPQDRATHGGWLFIGPTDWVAGGGGNLGLGRINCIDFHPTNDNIIFVGTAGGGIWKTSNGGTSWGNITPNIPLLSISDIEIDPFNANIIYALTGDGDPDISAGNAATTPEILSLGIIKSTDGGGTWYFTNFAFDYPGAVTPSKLLMNPTNPSIQYVAAQNGIYKTINGWSSYTQEYFGLIYDIEFKPGDPTIMYASGPNFVTKSTNSGDDWTTVTDPDFGIFNSGTRIELGVTPNFPTLVYAVGGDWGNYNGVLQSIFEGINNTWIIKDSATATQPLFGGQGRYNMALAVKDTDYRDLFVGMVGGARNYSQGATGGWTGIAIGHSDIHEIVYRNGNLYIANDAGLWKSTDDGTSSTEISKGIAMSQVYRVSGTPQNTTTYIIGAQDIGHHRRTSASTTFTNIGCCDGMVSIINYTNQNEIYIAGQNGGINKTTTGNPPFIGTGNPGDGGAWITPYIMDPVDPTILFVGKDSVHRTTNSAGSWQYIGSPSSANLNVLAQGTSNRNRLYASRSGNIWRSDNALATASSVTWQNVTSGLPSLFITDIAVDPANSLHVYVSLSGYSTGQKIFVSTNGGTASSWTNISGSLPNTPVNTIVYHANGQDGLYIGTDIGVFYRDNTIGDWIYYSDFLPSVIVNDLYINTSSNVIAAATFGRGLWISDLYDGCDPTISLTGLFGPLGGVYYYSASSTITSAQDYRFDIGTEVHYSAGNYIDLTDGFLAGGQGFFEGVTGPCPDVTTIDPLLSPFRPSGKLEMSNIERLILRN